MLVSVIAMSAVAEAQTYDRRVRIINESSYTMIRFFGSHIGTNSWEEDILGSDVLYPGKSVMINFDDGTGYCKFDFKAVFEGGIEVIDNSLDVCSITHHRYVD